MDSGLTDETKKNA